VSNLASVYDVSGSQLIKEIAKDLKENKKIKMPDFAYYVKTGSHRERAPQNPDWWYIRMASILRRVYISGNVNVESLRTYYGGKKRRGVRPPKFKKAGGKIIRLSLQELEKLGYVKKDEKGGRAITKEGQKYLDKLAVSLYKKMYPEKKATSLKEKTDEVSVQEKKLPQLSEKKALVKEESDKKALMKEGQHNVANL
jgi:small subunit ribosomal protein S19e